MNFLDLVKKKSNHLVKNLRTPNRFLKFLLYYHVNLFVSSVHEKKSHLFLKDVIFHIIYNITHARKLQVIFFYTLFLKQINSIN